MNDYNKTNCPGCRQQITECYFWWIEYVRVLIITTWTCVHLMWPAVCGLHYVPYDKLIQTEIGVIIEKYQK